MNIEHLREKFEKEMKLNLELSNNHLLAQHINDLLDKTFDWFQDNLKEEKCAKCKNKLHKEKKCKWCKSKNIVKYDKDYDLCKSCSRLLIPTTN